MLWVTSLRSKLAANLGLGLGLGGSRQCASGGVDLGWQGTPRYNRHGIETEKTLKQRKQSGRNGCCQGRTVDRSVELPLLKRGQTCLVHHF